MHRVHHFLNTHWDRKSPLLIGFSGGPDSLALLSTLIEYRNSINQTFKLGLAHVDHSWRKESTQEAKQLELLADELSLPFHLKTLNPTSLKGNLEAACREERLKFFKELCHQFNYQAVILGHHADDQAETVLKKILEGSNLPYLSGLRPIAEVLGITLWRPMLHLSKDAIRQWLHSKELTPIEDWTNLDPKFLRGKFRTQIIPQLKKCFGKEITGTLSRLGQEAAELRDYFDDKISPYAKFLTNRLGSFLDLSQLECLPPNPEFRYLLKRFCEHSYLSLSWQLLEKAMQLISSGVADRRLCACGREIFIDRRRIFILSADFPPMPSHQIPLDIGQLTYGPWKIQVAPSESPLPGSQWETLWKEGGSVSLSSEKGYTLCAPQLNVQYPGGNSIRKWWTNHKIPAFLRLQVPVIYKDERVFHEFLTGRSNPKSQMGDAPWIRVKISL